MMIAAGTLAKRRRLVEADLQLPFFTTDGHGWTRMDTDSKAAKRAWT
jgi:uncharacterized protein YdaU (DUF1376 family)